MKKIFFCCWLLLAAGGIWPCHVQAQEQELQQLALDIEKLAEFKKILTLMYDGYKIVKNGYDKVKSITSGTYSIHEVFLDGLYLVNPEIRKYSRVADIISYQIAIVSEYKSALKLFRSSGAFDADKLSYLEGVYSKLFDDSVEQLDELTSILTAQQLRMSDDERLAGIDRIYDDMQRKLLFLRNFNLGQKQLAISAIKDKTEVQTIKNLHGIGN
ncbi:hypothetical protein [[Flexibacter] sp. ATCC 35208]|uniref:hypothetical protein n=1 Tax=[Flexibacter] sp. ATCC 35208 TaxID=1936242 RepID=UPI0009CA0318|nr:hypothetical protein [[Flexibacter] sp. ATCC 35208]OMP80088.1 hypothetical protein BW716_06240 [[Flexibacter] sp. ATCC 35208]